MSNKKYVICAGWVISQSDGDEHYIDGLRLAELYKVDPSECVFIEDPSSDHWQRGLTQDRIDEIDAMTHLYPRFDGKYDLPE